MTDDMKKEIKEKMEEENQAWALGLVKTLEGEIEELKAQEEKLKDLLNRSNIRLAEVQIENENLRKENNILIKGLGCETCSIHLEFEKLNNQIDDLKLQIEKLANGS